jgi:hypothetical protein
MNIEEVKALCYENEYNDGKYHMFWLDEDDVSREGEYDTKEEMIEDYNELWSEGAWDFTWIDTNGHEFYPWTK